MPDTRDTTDATTTSFASGVDDTAAATGLADVSGASEGSATNDPTVSVPEGGPPAGSGLDDLSVTISDDRLIATLTLPPLRGAAVPAPAVLVERLRGKHRLVDVDVDAVEQALDTALDTETETTPTVVARGLAPTDGEDGHLEWLGDFFDSRAIRLPSGAVDHYHRTKVSVFEGQPILRVHSPTTGTPGTDVTGRRIAATPGAPAPLECDDTVRRHEHDSRLVCAARPGMVEYSHGELTVGDLQVVEQVDFSTGSIDFEGAVHVRGTVMPKFSVVGTDSVIIDGTVENARIESRRNVTIDKGVMGRGDAVIVCAGDLSLGFAREATIECGGRLDARRELLWCEGRVHEDLLIENGRIIGGRWIVGGSIAADEIGSREEAATFVTLGRAAGQQRELRTLTRARKKYQQQLADLRRRYGPMLSGAVGSLNANEREVVEQRMRLYERRAIRSRKREFLLRKRLHQQRHASFVWVKSRLFAGTRLGLNGGQHVHEFTEDVIGPACVRYDARTGRAVIEHVGLENASRSDRR